MRRCQDTRHTTCQTRVPPIAPWFTLSLARPSPALCHLFALDQFRDIQRGRMSPFEPQAITPLLPSFTLYNTHSHGLPYVPLHMAVMMAIFRDRQRPRRAHELRPTRGHGPYSSFFLPSHSLENAARHLPKSEKFGRRRSTSEGRLSKREYVKLVLDGYLSL